MPNTHTTLTSLFSDIADSIRAKTGSSADIVADTFPTAIANIPTGQTEAEEKDINFYDYDGFRCASWTLAELATKTALPSNPDRTSEGLTADGWNWSLTDLKSTNRQMNVGQIQKPTDGKMHIFIELFDGRLSPVLGIGINGSATIDWGDGSTDSISGTSTSTLVSTQHTYASGGAYEIKVTPASGASFKIFNSSLIFANDSGYNRAYNNLVTKVFLVGNTELGSSAFQYFGRLKAIAIPSLPSTLGGSAFHTCVNLTGVVIPNGVTTLGGSGFQNCSQLKVAALPKSITIVGDNMFNGCSDMATCTIVPTATSMATAVFRSCSSLRHFALPDNITAINNNTFNGCILLESIVIPSGVTSIVGSAFTDNVTQKQIKFLPTSPPTVSSSAAWTNLPTDCKILVPYSADHSVLNAYKTANNYPDPTVYTYEEY